MTDPTDADDLRTELDTPAAVADGGGEYDRHDIRLRDVVQNGESKCPDDMDTALVATYDATYKPSSTFTEARSVSVRLPFECIVLFDDGVIEINDLTETERAWLRAESDGSIDFEGTKCGPSPDADAEVSA